MRNVAIICLVVITILLALFGCAKSSLQQKNVASELSPSVEENNLGNLRLTVYYLPLNILTRKPLSADDLITFTDTKRIIVESEDLETLYEQFKKLDTFVTQSVSENPVVNARLYYILEQGESERLIEVVISEASSTVLVNGVAVAYDSAFYELIKPFLTDDARNILSALAG